MSMKYLPFENFDVHTELTPDELFRRFSSAVETRWLIFPSEKFVGDVEKHYFRIRRVTWWNRYFTPIVSGKIQPEKSGCHLQIRMRMSWFGFLFYSFAFGFVWLSFFMGNANLVVRKIQTGTWPIESFWEWILNVLLYIVMLSFIYFMSVGTFKWEAYRSINYLLRLARTNKNNIIYRDQILGLTETQIVRVVFLLPLVISVGWMIFKLLF